MKPVPGWCFLSGTTIWVEPAEDKSMLMTLEEFLKKFPEVKSARGLDLNSLQGLMSTTEREQEIGRQVLRNLKQKADV